MGLWSRIFGARLKETTSTDNPANWFLDWAVGDGKSTAGVRVSPESAMRLSAVWACVRVRSEDVGKLPCHLYKRLAGGGKERAVDHPLYKLLNQRPNPRMTPFEFVQMMQAQLDLRGNALAAKELDARGRVIALWPWDWSRVTVYSTPDGKDIFYQLSRKDGTMTDKLPSEAVIHIRGMSLDGIVGLSPIAYHRETIGLAIAEQQHGAAFYGNNARPDGVLQVKRVLSAEAAKLIREQWEQKYRGSANAHRLAILDGEMEFKPTTMDHTDAQYIESRNFQNREIWRIYRVPAHKVGDLEKSTNNNIEQQALEYVSDCLLTELRRWEQALSRDLLTEVEQGQYFFEFLVDVLLRGDIKSRYEAYAIARSWGILNADEFREMENRNKIPDGKGEIYLQPLNMIEAGATPPSPGGAKALLALAQELVAREERKAQG